MNKLLSLTKLELLSSFGINRLIHTKDPRAKKRNSVLTFAWIFLIGCAFFYIGLLAYGFSSLGISKLTPAYLALLSSLLILAFGLFSAGSRIFGKGGYDIISSMPIKPFSIVASRFAVMYIEDLVFTLVIMIPGTAVYAFFERPDFAFYPISVIATLFIPLIPLLISAVFGSFIIALTSRMKHKNIAQTLFMLFTLFGAVAISFSLEKIEDLSNEALIEFAEKAYAVFGKIYLPSVWVGNAMTGADCFGLIPFILISVITLIISVYVFSILLRPVMTALGNTGAKHNYKIGSLNSRGLMKTLYIREIKRYFSSSIYVTNTIIGPVLGIILAVTLAFSGIDKIQESLPEFISLKALLPCLIATPLAMMPTTSVSISLEGKNIWIIKSLPLTAKALFDGKILLNLTTLIPSYIISEIILITAARPNPSELASLIILPIFIILFSVVFGITADLKFRNFDWNREATVVKQSLSSFVGGFAGALAGIVSTVPILLTPNEFSILAVLAVSLIFGTLTVIMYIRNSKIKLEEL